MKSGSILLWIFRYELSSNSANESLVFAKASVLRLPSSLSPVRLRLLDNCVLAVSTPDLCSNRFVPLALPAASRFALTGAASCDVDTKATTAGEGGWGFGARARAGWR